MLAIVVVAAVVMGLPTLKGTFVGGDDHRLVLDHVLVNHPSPSHALKLFAIVHRDLYQPLPLLSFSAEFAIATKLGLFHESVAGGARLFHLTNVVLHAVNAVLVWVVLLTLTRRPPTSGRSGSARHSNPASDGARPTVLSARAYGVATIAAILFAVHPLEVEVVAWINGRMMLLSTLFALASLAALGTWLRTNRTRWAIAVVLFVAFCAMSKIRIALPLLLLIVPLFQGRRITPRFIALWVVCGAITGAFAIVNYMATAEAGMFEGAVRNLHGPRAVRALLALAWYFQHFAWPTGLASWYPTPGEVAWSDPITLRALAVVVPALAVVAYSAWRWRVALFGFAWFFVAIASTIQLVPTRNALAADRYMYLPIIGLVWVAAAATYALYERAGRGRASPWIRVVSAVLGGSVAVTMLLMSWHTASFYETPSRKSRRIAELAPSTAHVWERVAWSYHNAGEHEQAIEYAKRELERDDVNAHSAAWQVIGMSQLHLGRPDDAIASLYRAIELVPDGSNARYNLAKVLEKLGRVDEALRYYEETVRMAPLANPRILRLASLYRKLNRPDDARGMYEKALANNPYDVTATMALAELDMEISTPEAYQSAQRRLVRLLDWMPENSDARVNLGVVHFAMGRTDDAIEAYSRVLSRDPSHASAALNLAVIYQGRGDLGRAAALFESAAGAGLESVDQVVEVHDFLIASGGVKRAALVWERFLARFPESIEARAFLAWSRALGGQTARAKADANALHGGNDAPPLVGATLAYVALENGLYDVAVSRTEELCATGVRGTDARRRLLGAVERFDQAHPNVPWSFCLAARLLIAEGRAGHARAAVELFESRCDGPSCRDRVTTLKAQLSSIRRQDSDLPGRP